MSWRILITAHPLEAVGQSALQVLRDAGCTLQNAPQWGPLSEAQVRPLLPGTDAVLASTDKFTADVLRSSEAASLKIISRWGVGYDAIDIQAATDAGICIAYTPGLLNEAVADYAFALLCAVARGVHSGSLDMSQQKWQPAWGGDIFGKTLGVVGCGRIGLAVARRAAGFNMRLLAFDPHLSAEAEKSGVRFVPLQTLMAESDFVSIHAALTPQTRGIIGAAQIGAMKPTAYLINTARGALLDETALARALQDGKIAGAALDAFSIEPLPADHIFFRTPNLLLTPHQASYARETGAAVSQAACQAIAELMAGKRPKWVVNPDVFSSPKLRAKIS